MTRKNKTNKIMKSGIYRDLASNEDFVVFGGRIARSVGWNEDRKEVLLHFVPTDEIYEVGAQVSEATFNNKPQVGLVFNNPQSVDIIIRDLEYVRDILNGMLKEELETKYNDMLALNEPTGENEE